MTCPIAHYADLPGYTQADVEAACLLAHANDELDFALTHGPSDRVSQAIAVYNVACRESLPDDDDARYRAVMHLTLMHDKLSTPTAASSRPSSPTAAGNGGGR